MAETGTDIYKAAEILKNGGIVAIPTETVYGLAANALNKKAVTRIFQAKNRPFFDPLIVHISDIAALEKYALEVPVAAQAMAQALWPGPITLVLKKKEIIPEMVTAGSDTVGLRVPNHPLTLSLLKLLDFPLAAPSANPFGYISPTTAAHVNQQLGNAVDYILDGGPSQVGLESTIVRFTDGLPEVLRLGGTSPETLKKYLGEYKERLHQNSDPMAPGQLDKHYSPHTRIILIGIGETLPAIAKTQKTALIRFQNQENSFPKEHQFILSPAGSTEEAAMNLFDIMRKLDSETYALIVAEKVPETGLGRAINDRLQRAATQG